MQIRELLQGDHDGVSRVCAASARSRWTPTMLEDKPQRIVLVASIQDRIAGVAKTHFHPTSDGDAPAGNYLGGIVVAPEFRRLGVGASLTRARLNWIWADATVAYYFTNEHNVASIGMHQALGFQEVGRFGAIHGVSADDGVSRLVLFQAFR